MFQMATIGSNFKWFCYNMLDTQDLGERHLQRLQLLVEEVAEGGFSSQIALL